MALLCMLHPKPRSIRRGQSINHLHFHSEMIEFALDTGIDKWMKDAVELAERLQKEKELP